MSSVEVDIDVQKAIPKLKGELNYSVWKKAIKLILQSKDAVYWDILISSRTAPTKPELYLTDINNIYQAAYI